MVLRSYVLTYSKVIDLAYTELSKGNVMDAEDCWLEHYGLPVHMSNSVSDIIPDIEEALQWLSSPSCDGEFPAEIAEFTISQRAVEK